MKNLKELIKKLGCKHRFVMVCYSTASNGKTIEYYRCRKCDKERVNHVG